MKFVHHTSVTISQSGDVVTFRDKLPGRAKRLTGIFLSANTNHATKALANVGVNFNGGRSLITNQLLRIPASDPVRKSYHFQVNQDIKQNSSVNGYIEDLGNASAFPYTVKIYYQLSD